MNIACISTYPPALCGIATYVRDLANALTAQGHTATILAEVCGASNRPQDHVYYVWDRRMHYNARAGLGGLFKTIVDGSPKPDVVHIQHEFGLFPVDGDFLRFEQGLRDAGLRVMTTLHTVLLPPKHSTFFRHIDNVIVHTALAEAVFRAINVDAKVFCIPHGVGLTKSIPNIEAKKKLGVFEGALLLLVPGFMSRSKNILEIIEAFALCLSETDVEAYRLAVVGECRDDTHYRELESSVNEYGIKRFVTLNNSYQSDAQRHLWFSAADAVVLGAGKGADLGPYSASGQLATALGYGLPVIAKDTAIYQGSEGVLYFRSANECATWMNAIRSGEFRGRLAAKALEAGEARSWDKIAKDHVELYGRVALG